jgi:hypothetical protein
MAFNIIGSGDITRLLVTNASIVTHIFTVAWHTDNLKQTQQFGKLFAGSVCLQTQSRKIQICI